MARERAATAVAAVTAAAARVTRVQRERAEAREVATWAVLLAKEEGMVASAELLAVRKAAQGGSKAGASWSRMWHQTQRCLSPPHNGGTCCCCRRCALGIIRK